MKVVRAQDSPPSKPRKFTGDPKINRRLDEQRLAGMRVARVTFNAGERTFWHRHHGEQVLYVLSGRGWVQTCGEKPQAIEPGDIVYVPPDERHWHGAQAGRTLEHVALTAGETEWGKEVPEPPPSAEEVARAAAKDEAQLKRTNVRFADWEQRRDDKAIENLDKVLSTELVFRRADGKIVGKREFMAGLREPSPFAKRESENVAVEVREDRALVTLTVTTVKADGTEGRYRNIRLFTRRDGDWRLEFWFNDATHVTGV